MKKTEYDYDFTNIDDIFEEKIDFSKIFHFELVQRILEQFIRKQNIMNKKINDLEIKFETWQITRDLVGDTENSNKMENKEENKKESESDIDNEDINKESEKILDIEINDEEIIDKKVEEKVKKLKKKIKILETVNKEMSQRLIINNNQNSNFVESSTEKINQMKINFKYLDTALKGKDRFINNKMNNLERKIESLEKSIEENYKTTRNLNSNIIYLQKLKKEDILKKFSNYKNINDKVIKDIKNIIEEKLFKFKKNLNNSESQSENKDIFSPVYEFQLNDSINALKDYFMKNISEINKSYKEAIEDLNISKINQEIINIQNELKEKIDKNLLTLKIKAEDSEIGISQLKDENKEINQRIESNKEKIEKNIDYLSVQVSRLNQIESQKGKQVTDYIKKEGVKLFIQKSVYEEDITKIMKKLEKIFEVHKENSTRINTMEKEMKFFITDREIKNIEHYTLNMIQEFKINAVKKFLDRKEGIKSLRLLGE